MAEYPQIAIGTTEIARLMHVDRKTIQRKAKVLPGRLPPHRSPGRGYWFERPIMLKWIEGNKQPEADRHRRGRKRKAPAPRVGQQWRKVSEVIPRIPYNLFRSRRRVGCAEFVALLTKLAEDLAPLAPTIEKVKPRVLLESEYRGILKSLRLIRDTSQDAINRFLGITRPKGLANVRAKSTV
jgi:hypothetical protein